MAQGFDSAMPPSLDLPGGYTVRLTAVNPTTGDQVPGITVSNLLMLTLPLGDTVPGDLAVGPFLLVPGPDA